MKPTLRFAIDMEEAVIVSAPDGPRSSTVAFPIIDYEAMVPHSWGIPMPWKIVMFPMDAHFRGRFRWLTPTEVATIPARLRTIHEGVWRGGPGLFTEADLADVRTVGEIK